MSDELLVRRCKSELKTQNSNLKPAVSFGRDAKLVQPLRRRVALLIPAMSAVVFGQHVVERRQMAGGAAICQCVLAPASRQCVIHGASAIATSEYPLDRD